MAKQSGIGARFLCGGYDISGDTQALDGVGGGPALWDVADITQPAHSRLGLLRDGKLGFTVFFDAANAHPVLSALPRTDELMTFMLPPLAITTAPIVACLNAKQIGYDPTRGADGSLTLKVQGEGNKYGLEWCAPLTAGLRTDTGATDGTDLDNGADSTYGLQAYLQVTAFTGTDCTVKVEHSADNSSWSDLITFTQTTAAPQADRQAVTGTVDEYLRVSTVTTGGFSSVTFMVAVNRNPVETDFL